jgi:hypothetical protein
MEKKIVYVKSYLRKTREPHEMSIHGKQGAKARWEKRKMREKFLQSQGHSQEQAKEIAEKEMYFER